MNMYQLYAMNDMLSKCELEVVKLRLIYIDIYRHIWGVSAYLILVASFLYVKLSENDLVGFDCLFVGVITAMALSHFLVIYANLKTVNPLKWFRILKCLMGVNTENRSQIKSANRYMSEVIENIDDSESRLVATYGLIHRSLRLSRSM